MLSALLRTLCTERAGEEAVCEVASLAVDWAASRCAAAVAAAPEPEPEPAPAGGGALSKYERTKLREARQKRAQQMELAAQRAEVVALRAGQLAAADALGLPPSEYAYEVLFPDGGWLKVAAAEVLVRLRPPLDRTIADSFAAMPPLQASCCAAPASSLFSQLAAAL